MHLSAAMAWASDPSFGRHFWLFDTFEGMAVPTQEDGNLQDLYEGIEKGTAAAARVEYSEDGSWTWNKIDEDRCNKTMLMTGYPPEKVHLVKGLAQDTLTDPAQPLPEKIAIMALDTDYYVEEKSRNFSGERRDAREILCI